MNNINNIIKNFFWRFAERSGAQIVQVIVFILLARLLTPEMFGTIAILMVFITILQVFIDSGFGTALIQKKDADNIDFSSVFYFNIAISSFLYLIMFFLAPYIAKFYNDISMTNYIRVICLLLIIAGVKNIQQAYVSRNMLFKKFFFSTLAGTIISAFIGVYMAYKGFGVWALIAQQLSNAAIDTLTLWITVKWHPQFVFSFSRLKILFANGSKLLIAELINAFYGNLRQLIIGKLYTKTDLAFYNKGLQIPHMVISNVNASIDSILLPVMSKEQDSTEQVKNITRKSIQVSVYIMSPIVLGMAVTSYSFVPLILTDKWLPCIPYLWVFCITSIFYPIHTANLNAIRALGRFDLILKLEIIKKITGIIMLVSTMWFGVLVMAYSVLLTNFLSQLINSYPNKKLLNYGYLQQLKDILPNLFAAVFTCVCMHLINLCKLSYVTTIIAQIAVGITIYLIVSYIFKLDAFMYILKLIQRNLQKK